MLNIDKARVIDLHPNNQKVTDMATLKQGGVCAIIAKGWEGDSLRIANFPDFCQQCYDENMPLLSYGWHNPNLYTSYPMNDPSRWPDPDPQITNALRIWTNKKLYGYALDIEQFWQSYPEYYEYLRTKDASKLHIVPAGWINASAKHVAAQVYNTWKHKGIILNYSAKWFADAYCRELYDWMAMDPYWGWIATYWWGIQDNLATWKDLDRYIPPDTYIKNGETKSTWPWFGNARAKIWQWSGDQFTVPGIVSTTTNKPCYVDMNLVDMSREAFWEAIGFNPGDDVDFKTGKYAEGGSTTPVEPGDDEPDNWVTVTCPHCGASVLTNATMTCSVCGGSLIDTTDIATDKIEAMQELLQAMHAQVAEIYKDVNEMREHFS